MLARLSSMFGSSERESPSESPSNYMPGNLNCPQSAKNNDLHYEHKDNSVSVYEKMAHLYAEKMMSDIILCVGHWRLPAHRLILCASSEVFQVMLMRPEWNESREKTIHLQEAPECVEVFEKFLRYIYTGQLTLSHNSLLPILALADKYIVKDLIQICETYMIEHMVSAANNGYLFSWLQYTIVCGHKDIQKLFLNHVKWNFESVASSEEFGCCDVTLLTSLLSHHDIVITDEMTLYNYIVLWLQKQEQRLLCSPSSSKDSKDASGTLRDTTVMHSVPSEVDGIPANVESQESLSQPSINQFHNKYYLRRESITHSYSFGDQMEYLTQEVMRFIRFPMMTPRQLADLLLVPLTIKYKEFFVTRMAIGMSFHSGQWDRIRDFMKDSDASNQLLFTPRLYTAEQWGACLTVDNIPSLRCYSKRTLVFSTPTSASEIENNDSQLEWIVELYPKGVWFHKFYLIEWRGKFELPEIILRTVRLAITAKDADHARVRIAVLVYGVQDDIEHILDVVIRRHIFTADDSLFNMDDILPYDVLNKPEGNKYLSYPMESLKIHVVISPLSHPSMNFEEYFS